MARPIGCCWSTTTRSFPAGLSRTEVVVVTVSAAEEDHRAMSERRFTCEIEAVKSGLL